MAGVRTNTLKQKIEDGQIAFGAWHTFNSPETIEIIGAMGFDFVTFDLEHEPFSELELVQSIRAAESFGLASIVRVHYDADLILRLLNAGAQGVHIPRVNTRQDAEAVVKACRFHPHGNRTFYAVGRSGNYGVGITEEEYAVASNREVMVILQVEEEQGVRNITDILSVPGVDAVQVGPKDLWQSMGMPPRSVVKETVERVLAQTAEAGVWTSMVARLDANATEQIRRGMELGVKMITVSPRDLLVAGGKSFFEQVAQACDQKQ